MLARIYHLLIKQGLPEQKVPKVQAAAHGRLKVRKPGLPVSGVKTQTLEHAFVALLVLDPASNVL